MEEELIFRVNQEALLKNGLKLLKFGNVDEAVTCFQNYLQFNLNDIKCWQCLADAYFLRGSYKTAIKAYIKSIQLKEDNGVNDFYAELRIAGIHQMIHAYDNALNDYQVILDQNPDNVPALLGKAETLLCLARSSFNNGFLNEGENYCQKVINTIEKSLLIRDDLAIQYDILSLCNLLLINNMTEMSNDDKFNIIQVGIKNTNKALSINLDSQYYWHHLGIFYWHLYQINYEKRILLKSIQSLLNAININPKNSNIWNTLGVVAGDYLPISQHLFLKSMKLCPASTEMQWSNIGVLYLKDASQSVNLEDDLVFQAHKAFNQSQAQNPNYVNCWIGQALIAENVNHSSTLDLFRHSNTLNPFNKIGTIKFAYHLLLDTNQHFNQADLFNLAIDNMRIYIKKKSDDPLALNLLGCLLERRSYRETSFKLFEKALRNTFNSTDYVKNCILVNYLRNAAYFKKPEELNINEELLKTLNDWRLHVYLCLSNLLNKNYEDAYLNLNNSIKLVDNGAYVYYLIDAFRYLLSDKLNKSPAMSFNNEILQTNEPLRTTFVVNSMLTRNYTPLLKEIITTIMVLPKLIDMILINLFSQDSSNNFVKDFQNLPQTWIKQCLDYLINIEHDAKNDLKEFNRVYRNFISCKQIKPKQLVGFNLILSLNLIESTNEEILKKSLIYVQTAMYLMPYNEIVKKTFYTIKRIVDKEIDYRSFFVEVGLDKLDYIVFLFNFLN